MQKILRNKFGITSVRPGQSLVETALIVPLLMFMLIGVLEVGWVLRGYLVLVNVNREITRFAVRPGYLDFSTQADVITSYIRIRDWAFVSLTDQLDMDFTDTGDINNTGNTTLIVTHIVVDTGLPCEDIQDPEEQDNCDCDRFLSDPGYNPFPLDDLIIYPGRPGMEYQTTRFGPITTTTGIRQTRIDYDDLLYDEDNGLVPRNNKFNCELIKKGGVASANNVIITELFYDQPQLFGFPLIANPYTDPVPLYTHTTMRIVSAARSTGREGGDLTGSIDTIGPICNAMPFAVKQTTVAATGINQKMDIFDGPGGENYGWLAWNPGKTGEDDLKRELKYSASSLNDFINAADGSDQVLSVGDSVASLPGSHVTVESTDGLISALVGKKMRIPVWDSFNGGRYHISGFVWVQIGSGGDINPDTPDHEILATYLPGDASADCP